MKALKSRSTDIVDADEAIGLSIDFGDRLKTKRRPISVWKDSKLKGLRKQIDNLGDMDLENETHLNILFDLMSQTAQVLCTMHMKQIKQTEVGEFKEAYEYCL